MCEGELFVECQQIGIIFSLETLLFNEKKLV